jgi:hypothetical protein
VVPVFSGQQPESKKATPLSKKISLATGSYLPPLNPSLTPFYPKKTAFFSGCSIALKISQCDYGINTWASGRIAIFQVITQKSRYKALWFCLVKISWTHPFNVLVAAITD